jgi:GNAT superfamily N-acetyltransferase
VTGIRPVEAKDRSEWEVLYRGYADFYEVEMTDEKLSTLWSWLHDPSHVEECRVYESDGHLVGLMHFRAMPSPLRAGDVCFLDDLFVDPVERGKNAGKQLLEDLQDVASERGWDAIRWITRDTNYRAKALYDRMATKTYWHTYEMAPKKK